MDYSLVVVSRNRPAFLARLLSYYARHSAAPIVLGDASEGDNLHKVERVVDAFRDRVPVLYTRYSADTPLLVRLRAEFAKVTTPYVAWVGDDDFLLPAALSRAAAALERDASCAGVIGNAVLFAVEGDGAQGRLRTVGNYLQQGCAAPDAAERLLAQASHGTCLTYAMRRTALIRDILDKFEVEAWPDDVFGYHFYEVADAFLTALGGNVIVLDQLMMARQAHIGSTAASAPKEQRLHRMIVHPQWAEWTARFLGLLTRELMRRQPALSGKRAGEVVEAAFCERMRSTLRKPLAGRQSPPRRAFPGVPQWVVGLARRRQRLLMQRVRLGAHEYGELSKVLRLVENAAEPADVAAQRTDDMTA
jgi:glycosyltransferase domain-containing protein